MQPAVIRNVFPKTSASILSKATIKAEKVKLCWFSQTIGPNRGLENVLQAISYLDEQQFELHLLGAARPGYIQILFSMCDLLGLPVANIHIHEPMLPNELFVFCSAFDIGLACEIV